MDVTSRTSRTADRVRLTVGRPLAKSSANLSVFERCRRQAGWAGGTVRRPPL